MPSETGKRGWAAAGSLLFILLIIFTWLGRKASDLPDPVPPPPPPAEPAAPAPDAPVTVVSAADEDPDLALALPAGSSPPRLVRPLPPPPLPKPPLVFDLPTPNRSIFDSEPEKFFMFVDRPTDDGPIKVWKGGDFGFVRNPRKTVHGTIFTRFHEGIDIAPVSRDAKGEPLDEVMSIADGVVVYATASKTASNYGNYVVVEHPLEEGGTFYSLYAHLDSIAVTAGTEVGRGAVLGEMGYTGVGLDQRRAHLHLEIGLIVSERFDEYYAKSTAQRNPHGNYHGSNLIGFNAVEFLVAHAANPGLMPHDFLQTQEVYYKVSVPSRGAELEIATRYPWLRRDRGTISASWEISFTGIGIPVNIVPGAEPVAFPTVSWVKPYAGYHSWNTRSLLGGSGNTATLTAAGNRFMTLLTGDF